MKIINESELMLRASRGLIQGWYSDKEPTTDKPRLDTLLDAYRSDPTVRGAITAIADETLKNGYHIVAKDKKLKERIEKDLKKKFRFTRILNKLLNNLLIYGNVFIEIVYKGSTPEEIHILETTEMQILADEHGEVYGYLQRAGAQGEEISFTTDEVVHISIEHVKSNLWGEVDLETIYSILNLKQHIEGFLTNLFKYNKFRDSWVVEDANENQVKDFLNNLRLVKDQPWKELVIDGKISKVLGRPIEDLDKLIEILNYCRQEILTLLRVPPIIAGIPDNSNRSNSEVQARKAFDTRIKILQQAMEEEFSFELFPLMKWGNADFKFNPIDKRAEKDDIEIAKILRDMGLDDESLLEYIKNTGIQLPESAKFEKALPPMFGGEGKDKDKEDDMKDEASPVEHKTGAEAETREEQLVGRSLEFSIDPTDVDETI
jgi:hypothetical protein